MTSAIQTFYKDKIIFLTGATGFLGKVVIEKVLRTTEVKCIYILMREKRGYTIQQRMETLSREPLFEILLKEKPKAFDRLHIIEGDCSLPDLGISETDRQLLISEVQVVIHGAATVRFNDPLHVALNINTRGTLLMLQFAKQMSGLEAFVHVSTAYSNCVIQHIEERFYPEHLTCSADKVLKLSSDMGNNLFDNMEYVLRGKFPNTYVYTKALAEQLVQEDTSDMPLCVFRPGIILASYKEPVMGWCDNLYGPIALLYGTALGIVRVSLCNGKAHTSIVPVDYSVNALLASAWRTAVDGANKKTSKAIYNFTTHTKNPLTWREFINHGLDRRHIYPLTHMIWYPFLIRINSKLMYIIMAYILHIIPGYVIDLALCLKGQKPKLIPIYKKLHMSIDILEYFSIRTWHFDTRNTEKLREIMSPEDREIYDFNMLGLDWNNYFHNALAGMRHYLAKDGPDTFERGKKRFDRFKMAHYSLSLLGFVLAILLIKFCIKL